MGSVGPALVDSSGPAEGYLGIFIVCARLLKQTARKLGDGDLPLAFEHGGGSYFPAEGGRVPESEDLDYIEWSFEDTLVLPLKQFKRSREPLYVGIEGVGRTRIDLAELRRDPGAEIEGWFDCGEPVPVEPHRIEDEILASTDVHSQSDEQEGDAESDIGSAAEVVLNEIPGAAGDLNMRERGRSAEADSDTRSDASASAKNSGHAGSEGGSGDERNAHDGAPRIEDVGDVASDAVEVGNDRDRDGDRPSTGALAAPGRVYIVLSYVPHTDALSAGSFGVETAGVVRVLVEGVRHLPQQEPSARCIVSLPGDATGATARRAQRSDICWDQELLFFATGAPSRVVLSVAGYRGEAPVKLHELARNSCRVRVPFAASSRARCDITVTYFPLIPGTHLEPGSEARVRQGALVRMLPPGSIVQVLEIKGGSALCSCVSPEGFTCRTRIPLTHLEHTDAEREQSEDRGTSVDWKHVATETETMMQEAEQEFATQKIQALLLGARARSQNAPA